LQVIQTHNLRLTCFESMNRLACLLLFFRGHVAQKKYKSSKCFSLAFRFFSADFHTRFLSVGLKVLYDCVLHNVACWIYASTNASSRHTCTAALFIHLRCHLWLERYVSAAHAVDNNSLSSIQVSFQRSARPSSICTDLLATTRWSTSIPTSTRDMVRRLLSGERSTERKHFSGDWERKAESCNVYYKEFFSSTKPATINVAEIISFVFCAGILSSIS